MKAHPGRCSARRWSDILVACRDITTLAIRCGGLRLPSGLFQPDRIFRMAASERFEP